MFSVGIEHALKSALLAHAGQTRKGDDEKPYAVHSVHVAMILAQLGADQDVIQAGILHDVVEDCEDWDAARLEAEFGHRVASIVAELTEDKSRSWEERKAWAVSHAAHLSAEAAMVKAVDTLHNLESLNASLAEADDHDAIWARFKGGRERTIEMKTKLVEALVLRVPPQLARALEKAIAELAATSKTEAEAPAPLD